MLVLVIFLDLVVGGRVNVAGGVLEVGGKTVVFTVEVADALVEAMLTPDDGDAVDQSAGNEEESETRKLQ